MSSSEIRAPKKQLSDQPSSLIASLPDDVIINILARVPRCNYPNLSLVSKHFWSIVSSDELYARRILLGCTEACIYVAILKKKTNGYRWCWHILRRKGKSNRLVPIQSLPPMASLQSLVSAGLKIYVLGRTNYEEMTPSSLCIDCRSHAVQPFPSFPRPMIVLGGDIINEKIYVIGFCNEEWENFMLVFNTKTQMWEPEMTKLDMETGNVWCSSVVIAGKISMRDSRNSFVYMPKECKWETDEMLNSKCWTNACAIDDLICYYDYYGKKLRAYDTKQRLWRVVKGVGELFPKAFYFEAHTVSYGGKLAVFLRIYDSLSRTEKICCVEIALERRGGEIWGNVDWRDVVVNGNFALMKSLVVMV